MPTPTDSRILERRIQYVFRDQTLLTEALTHPSFAAENARVSNQNQRLEFLGDSVLQMLFTDRLYRDHPEAPEGVLTQMRAVVTRQRYFAELARGIDLGSYLRLGNGEAAAGGADRPSNLCDVFEALFGAVYLDSGGLSAPAAVLARLLQSAPVATDPLARDNPKGELQEFTQQHFRSRPEYLIIEQTGPDHDRRFVVAARLRGRQLATGSAGRRQDAEQAAAAAALIILRQQSNDEPES